MSDFPENHTKFVVAGSVALFESWTNGRRRIWELPVRKPQELTETRDAYTVSTSIPYDTIRF